MNAQNKKINSDNRTVVGMQLFNRQAVSSISFSVVHRKKLLRLIRIRKPCHIIFLNFFLTTKTCPHPASPPPYHPIPKHYFSAQTLYSWHVESCIIYSLLRSQKPPQGQNYSPCTTIAVTITALFDNGVAAATRGTSSKVGVHLRIAKAAPLQQPKAKRKYKREWP